MEKISEAIETTESYLLFHPEDETVVQNKNIIITVIIIIISDEPRVSNDG